MRRVRQTLILLGLLLGSNFAPIVAADDLRSELHSLGKSVANTLKSMDHDRVNLGKIQAPRELESSGGSGIAQMVSDSLASQGIEISPNAKVTLQGNFTFVKTKALQSSDTNVFAVKVSLTLVDDLGEELIALKSNREISSDLTKLIIDEPAVIALAGATVEAAPTAKSSERFNKVASAIARPSAFVHESGEVAASETSDYGMQVIVDSRPIRPLLKAGRPFVEIAQGERYRLKLHNRSKFDAAVQIQIDGISVFEFSEVRSTEEATKGRPKYKHYIVPKHSSIVVTGWHRTNEKVDAFLVTDYAESAAGKLDQQNELGMINASFSAAWPVGAAPPPDEGAAKGRLGTGFGPPMQQATTEVARHTGALRSSVTVRYLK